MMARVINIVCQDDRQEEILDEIILHVLGHPQEPETAILGNDVVSSYRVSKHRPEFWIAAMRLVERGVPVTAIEPRLVEALQDLILPRGAGDNPLTQAASSLYEAVAGPDPAAEADESERLALQAALGHPVTPEQWANEPSTAAPAAGDGSPAPPAAPALAVVPGGVATEARPYNRPGRKPAVKQQATNGAHKEPPVRRIVHLCGHPHTHRLKEFDHEAKAEIAAEVARRKGMKCKKCLVAEKTSALDPVR